MALTAARNTKASGPIEDKIRLKVKGTTKIFAGSMVALKAGYAAPADGADNTSIVVGRAMSTVDNSGGTDGALSVDVEEGSFIWANSSGDAIAAADVGATVYSEDDQTICKTGDNKSAAGKLLGFEGTAPIVRTFIGVAANGATVP